MTHFNHDWDTTKTPAIPVSVGDRYYAQDLNDDFNYLKHLPYEVFLQGRPRGVMIAPNDIWDNDTNSLTLSGGFGVVSQDCIELDPDEDFAIPPKTHSSPRYERIPFMDVTLVLPNDGATHYIVATPTKRSLLQRAKALFTEQYASRIKYDGVLTVQDTAPTTEQILIGLCHDKEYCLLIDSNPDQCKDNIVLKKWFGQNKITQDFVSTLQSYYSTPIDLIETRISIDTVSDVVGIGGGTFNNCTITINTVGSDASTTALKGIGGGIFNNCTIIINTVSSGSTTLANNSGGIGGGTFNNCTITIATVNGGSGVNNSILNNCTITINTVSGGSNGGGFGFGVGSGISSGSGALNNCIITIRTVSNGNGSGSGVYGDNFNNCTIIINTVSSGKGIGGGTFNNCTITIATVNGGSGVNNSIAVYLYLTRIECSVTTNLASTRGKLNVLNDSVLHTS